MSALLNIHYIQALLIMTNLGYDINKFLPCPLPYKLYNSWSIYAVGEFFKEIVYDADFYFHAGECRFNYGDVTEFDDGDQLCNRCLECSISSCVELSLCLESFTSNDIDSIRTYTERQLESFSELIDSYEYKRQLSFTITEIRSFTHAIDALVRINRKIEELQ